MSYTAGDVASFNSHGQIVTVQGTLSYTDPGIENVKLAETYLFAGSTLTGTYGAIVAGATTALGKVVSVLRANVPVSAVVGTDVYGGRFPAAPVIPGVVVQRHGGPPGGGSSPMRKATIITKCFQTTEAKAESLHELVRTALVGTPDTALTHQTTLISAGIASIEEEQGPQDIIDPDGADKGTPYTLAFWVVWFK